jgi:hypothetical protein
MAFPISMGPAALVVEANENVPLPGTVTALNGILKVSTNASISEAAPKTIRFTKYADTRRFKRRNLEAVISYKIHRPSRCNAIRKDKDDTVGMAYRRNPDVQYHNARNAMKKAYMLYKSINSSQLTPPWESFFRSGYRPETMIDGVTNMNLDASVRRDNIKSDAEEDIQRLESAKGMATTLVPHMRRFVLDTGASYHLISRNSLTEDEEKRIYTADNPINLTTAGYDSISCTEMVPIYVPALRVHIHAYVGVGNHHPLIGVNKLCKDNGFVFAMASGQAMIVCMKTSKRIYVKTLVCAES